MKRANINIIVAVTWAFVIGFASGIGVTKAFDQEEKIQSVVETKKVLSQDEIDAINNEIDDLEKEKRRLENIKNDKYLVVINKDEDKRLDRSYEPNTLVKSKLPIKAYKTEQYLDKTVDDAAKKMFDDAKKDGIILYGLSLYRSYDEQNEIYTSKVDNIGQEKTEMYSAPPGASEHQTGFAFDLVSNNYTKLEEGFAKTKAYKWLDEHCQEYGFILRYPKEKEDITTYQYEPWHYRYVGIENAKKIKEKDMCLEEYIEDLDKQIEEIEEKIEKLNEKKR